MRMKTFAQAVRDYHNKGGGVFLFAENDPHHAHANVVLSAIYPESVDFSTQFISGNAPGTNFVHSPLLNITDASDLRHIPSGNGKVIDANHLAMTGIVVLYEGETVAGLQPMDQTSMFAYVVFECTIWI